MSVMYCAWCEKPVDTDFDEMMDGPEGEDICEACWDSLLEDEKEGDSE